MQISLAVNVASVGQTSNRLAAPRWMILVLVLLAVALLIAVGVILYQRSRMKRALSSQRGMQSNAYLFIGSVAFLLVAGFCVWDFYPSNIGNTQEAMALSAVVLTGLFLVVLLMAAMVIVYRTLGLADAQQPLALPEGSIRALIAFSLVLVFVCLAAFLYNEVNHGMSQAGDVTMISEAELNDLKSQFIVAYEQARDTRDNPLYEVKKDASGVPLKGPDNAPIFDTTKPLFNASYYTKPDKDANDFAKQIFTTLATIFVSVISFYFGSSATTSGVGAGTKVLRDSDGGKKGDSEAAVNETKAAAHDAQSAADRAATAAKNADRLAKSVADDKTGAALSNAKEAKIAQDAAADAAEQAKQWVADAQKAAADAAAAGSDVAKASAATAAALKARDAARDLAETAKKHADDAERLLRQI